MAIRMVEQGIQAIQSGNPAEGARLLRIALKEPDMSAQLRATTLMWLAESSDDVPFKIDCYRQANQADPQNADVTQRLNYWLARQLPSANQLPPLPNTRLPQTAPQGYPPIVNTPQQAPPNSMPPTTMPPGTVPPQVATGQFQSVNPLNTGQTAPMSIQGQQRVVGVFGERDGSGFFVTRDGLVATTRGVVGGRDHVNVDLLSGHRLSGTVVRAFPEYDVALIRVNAHVEQIPAISPAPYLRDNAMIVVMMHGGKGHRSQKRQTRNETNQPHWFPTLITRDQIDAGGAPIYDEHNLLVGMATRNTRRTNAYIYGLHISRVIQCVEEYVHTTQQVHGQRVVYCTDCGSISRAPQYSAFYCETCGSTLPYAKEVARYPQNNSADLYHENMHRPCANCQARGGYYNSQCLRCGYNIATNTPQG